MVLDYIPTKINFYEVLGSLRGTCQTTVNPPVHLAHFPLIPEKNVLIPSSPCIQFLQL